MPAWFDHVDIAAMPWIGQKVRAVIRPRDVARRAAWRPPPDALLVAHEYTSFPGLRERQRPAVLLEHHILLADVRAARRIAGHDVQAIRAQRRALRQAPGVIATSDRVAALIGPSTLTCPLPYPLEEVLPDVEEPVAAVVANWRWPPNAVALRHLLALWPGVRARLPAARLVLAGAGSDAVGGADGVVGLGLVPDSREILAGCAVVPFPCPPSTGPKVKVFEALSVGRAVMTTSAGIEGLVAPPDVAAAMTADASTFVDRLVRMLADPAHRSAVAAAGRRAVADHHAPRAVAGSFVECCVRLMTPG